MTEADVDVVLGTNLKGTILSVSACPRHVFSRSLAALQNL